MVNNKMIMVYIACPFTHKSRERVLMNIEVARHAGALIAETGASPLMPTVNSAGMELSTNTTADFWYEATARQLAACDVLFLCQGWNHSVGCEMEREQAAKMGIPIFTDMWEFENWMENRAWENK